MTVKQLHFTVNAESVVALCRQAWFYEDKEVWARDTIGYLAYGIGVDQIDSILHGVMTLKSTEDGAGCYLTKEDDESWLLEVQKHTAYLESQYYTFANRKVLRDIVDEYIHAVVGRLRDAMRTPGLLQLADPVILMRLEEKRREMHNAIFEVAGFSKKEIREWNDSNGSDDLCKFAKELSSFVDNETNWNNFGAGMYKEATDNE